MESRVVDVMLLFFFYNDNNGKKFIDRTKNDREEEDKNGAESEPTCHPSSDFGAIYANAGYEI